MLDVLARASLDGAILAAIVWAVCRALPRLSPAARTTLWWCAAAKFVVGLAWTTPVSLPILPAPRASVDSAAVSAPNSATPKIQPAVPAHSRESGVGNWPLGVGPWELTGALWLTGLGVSMGLGLRRWLRTRGAIDRSCAADASIARSAAGVAALLGLRRSPEVRLSNEIDSPLVSGLRRPVILLPAGRFPAMPSEQQRMALCHEMAHVKRGDVWLGCVPALAERIFFFHPLVRLAAREYVFWREAACDAAVIAALDTAPQSYGRLLLDLGVTGRAAPLAPAGAAWSFSNLKRRIIMLRPPATPSVTTRLLTVAAVAAAFAGLAPLQLTARPTSPEAPALEAEPAAEPQSTRSDRERLRYVYFLSDDHTMMSGGSGDMERARRHRRAAEPMLWFLSGGDEYVVRDAQVLAEVESVWEPVGLIGAEQGAIGAKQGEIGARQGEIGAKQGTIGAEQGMIGARQGTIGARQAALSAREMRRPTAEERVEIERERQALEKDMRALDAEMRALNEKMREFERPMRDLGEDMETLGREMEALGRKMEEASRKAEASMRALIEKAIRSGAAQKVR